MNNNRFGKYFSFSLFFISSLIFFVVNSAFIINSNTSLPFIESESNTLKRSDSPVSASTPALPYFPLVFSGFGIDHMNINLVNLKITGLAVGDEIGVFDGKYCVGSLVVNEKHMKDNGLSIPASANDSLLSNPNGYIQGHKITLKVYRTGEVYLLYFETVNNSKDIFEKGASMFALVDLSRSTGQTLTETDEKIKVYPNPFTDFLNIEINVSYRKKLTVSIFDINGRLIRTLYDGTPDEPLKMTWDGKDNNARHVPQGVYFCLINHTIHGIIYQGINK